MLYPPAIDKVRIRSSALSISGYPSSLSSPRNAATDFLTSAQKYFAELDKLNSKEETDKMEENVLGTGGVERDYYLDEAMKITKDYSDILNVKTAL